MYVEKRLKPTWDWILTVMDATEAQLRFGASLTDSADPAHPLHPLNVPSTSAATSAVNTATSKYNIQILVQDAIFFVVTFNFLFFFIFEIITN